eukprot:Protomagalhaensia_wolfi_Nauph_80__3651@NODE_3689_length_733_cov_565_404899_g2751_i1_p1_GENE_NODE_3689_length_733_cov_565_404899_g2751_i1NODE_3689_length_733_cov_565_404899_g2751_i1_p1_ORF_typecomplete_len123_score17_50_NODE_3689_length_733_cov_565_404899_g2751_i1131499
MRVLYTTFVVSAYAGSSYKHEGYYNNMVPTQVLRTESRPIFLPIPIQSAPQILPIPIPTPQIIPQVVQQPIPHLLTMPHNNAWPVWGGGRGGGNGGLAGLARGIGGGVSEAVGGSGAGGGGF